MAEITSDNLGLTPVVQGTANEAAQANDKGGNLDAFLTEVLEVDLASANYALATDPPEFLRYRKYDIVNCAVAARTLTVPDVSREFVVDMTDASNTETMLIAVSGGIDLIHHPGSKGIFETDGAGGIEVVSRYVSLSQAEYDALSPPDDNTLYLIEA